MIGTTRPSMDYRVAFTAAILAMACLAQAKVNIPPGWKRGKMVKYKACRELFSQDVKPYAVVSEDEGPYKKVCNCTFQENPPQTVRINCHYAREVVLPITIENYLTYLTRLSYFVVRYRIRESADAWRELRVEPVTDASGQLVVTQAAIDLDVGSGDPNVYEVEIYAVLNDNTRRLLKSDEVSAATGRSVLHTIPPGYGYGEETEYTQRRLSFRINFERITENSIDLSFTSESPETFKVDYIDNGRTFAVNLDSHGRAELVNLEANTAYVFVISYLRNGEWIEMRRKTVRTMSATSYPVTTYEPTFTNDERDITLTCPIAADVAVQTITWYKGTQATSENLIATYDVQSGETTYAPGKESNIEVDGAVLRISEATREDAGSYKCRYSILGTGPGWGAETQLVTLYITWQTLPGIVAYFIQYRPYGTTQQWQTVTLRDSDQPRTVVQDLQPLTQYEFQVYEYTGGVQGQLLDSVIKATGRVPDVEELPPPDACDNYFCGRGVCDPNPQPHCVCSYGFRGERCDIAVNFCDSNPCLNGGVCNPLPNGYLCQCRSGYSGRNCERERTVCNPNPCQNAGTCVSQPNGGYICRCRRGYGGHRCQLIDRNPCDPDPCVNGRCLVLGRNYRCECDRGFMGRNCDREDSAPSILLHCPIDEDTYGDAEWIRWSRVQERKNEIYRYDALNRRGAETGDAQFRGRLSSPTPDQLIIRDARPSDVGTYQCEVAYRTERISPPSMRLVRVPLDDDRVTVSWQPYSTYVEDYVVQHRDVEGDDDFITVIVPSSSRRYTFSDLRPGGIYEVTVTPHASGGDSQPVDITFISPDTPTTTVATTTRTTQPPSRGDSEPDYTEPIEVTLFGPPSPVEIGSTAYLHCTYPSISNFQPTITWFKNVGSSSQYLYNARMPPSPSAARISMTNRRQLQIKDFRQSDAGSYECVVKYDTDTGRSQGSGNVEVYATQSVAIPSPTNLIIDVTGPRTAVLTWQPPRGFPGVIGYVVRYHPSMVNYGEYQRIEVPDSRVVLENLEEGTSYSVEVQATDGTKFSEPLSGEFRQEVERIPSPTDFRVKILSATQAKISWREPVYEGITGYKVQYWDVSRQAAGNLVERRTTLTEMVLPNLIDGTEYQVWIQAIKSDALSPQLSRMFRKTTPIAPNAPALVRFRDVENDGATAYWDAPLGWKPTDKYRVAVKSLDEDNPYSKQYPDYAPQTLKITSLSSGVNYQLTVNTVRDGIPSAPVYGFFQTVDLIRLSAPYPAILTLECKTKTTDNIYRVRWYKIDNSGKSHLILTNVATSSRNQTIPNRRNLQFAGRVSAPSMTRLDIDNVQYPQDFGKYRCIASAPGRSGSRTFELVAQYPRNIAPPYVFQFDVIEESTAKITWKHPYAEDITGYSVRYWPTLERFGNEKSLETSELEATLQNLEQGTEYQVEIKSKINDRISDDSLVGSFINYAQYVRNINVERVAGTDDLLITWINPTDIDGTLFSIKESEDDDWNDQPPMSPDRNSRRFRYPMNPGDTIYIKISTLKKNIPTPVVVTYTEEGPTEVDVPDEEPEIAEPGVGSQGGDRSSTAKPSPVTNLRVEPYSTDGLRAVWEPTDVFFDEYRVVITNLDTREYEIINVTRSYITVTQLRPNHHYEVQVITVRNGVFSFPVTETITLGSSTGEDVPLPVQQPTNLRFSNIMRSRFTVSWDSPSDDITDFEVRYRPIVASAQWRSLLTRGYTGATLRGLRPGANYEVQITSIKENGDRSSPLTGSQRTQSDTGRQAILLQPDARVVEKTNDSFTLRWQEQNAKHRVIVNPIGGAGRRQTLNVPVGETSLKLTDLEPGKKYRAQIYATSTGRRSQPKVVYTTTRPNQPTDFRIVNHDSRSMVIRWTDTASTLTTGYKVIYFPTSTNVMEDVDVTTNRVEINDLEPETEYEIRVQTKQGNELSAPTIIRVTTKEDSIDAPGNVDAGVTGDDVMVRWTPVSDAEFYEVMYYPESNPERSVTRRISSPTSYIRLTDVLPDHYIVKVKSMKEGQLSPSIDRNVYMPVKPPRNLRISDVDRDELTASWEEPYNVNYRPTYDVIALPNGIHTPLELPSEKRTQNTNYTFERLEPETEYKVQVISRYGELKSAPITTIVSTAPIIENPENVTSELVEGAIILNWSPVPDVDEYEIIFFPVGEESDTRTVRLPSSTTYYQFPSPGPGEYEIHVVPIKGSWRGPATTVLQRSNLQAPTSVQFTDITQDSLVIEWVPPRTRALYQYKVTLTSLDDVTEEELVRTTSQNWLLFSGLQPATTYYAEVQTVFGDETSGPASATATTTVPIPRRIEIPEIGPGNYPIEVFWQEVPGADSYKVTYYPVGQEPIEVVVDGSVTTATLSDLIPETEYVVEVTAVINGISSSPNTINVNTRPIGAPPRVETQPSSDTVRVQWGPVENVDTYEVTYYPVGDQSSAVTKVVTSTYYDITDIEPGEYEITVTAVKSDHKSPTATIRQSIGVMPPTELEFADTTENEFVVVWSPSLSPDVTSYIIRATVPQDLTREPLETETEDTFARFEGLAPATTYLVEVIARTTDQQSKPLVGTITTEVPYPDHVRETLPDEEGSLEILWEPVSNVDNYEVTYYPVDGEPEIVYVEGDQSGVILHELRPGTEYVIEVRSIVDEIPSTPTVIRVTTPLAQPREPEAQPLSENSKPSPNTVRVTWDQDNTGAEYEVKYYTVVRVGDEAIYGEPTIVRVPGSDGGYTLQNLLPATEYVVEIKAVRGPETSRPGKVNVTTALDEPREVAIQEWGEQEATITWQQPIGDVTEYIIEFIPADGSETIRIPVGANTNTVTATGLEPGTEYEVRVVAVNTDRNVQSESTITHVRTRPIDLRPLNMRLTPESDGSYTIVWDTPSRPIDHYTVHWVTTDGSGTEETIEIPGDQNYVTLPSLHPNTEYEIVVQATTAPSEESTEFNTIVTRVKTDVPSLPDAVTAPEVSDTTLVVRWEVPDQESYLSGYRVEVFPEGSDVPVRAIDVPRTANTASFRDLKPNTSYVVKVTPHMNWRPGTAGTQTITTGDLTSVPSPDYVTATESTSEDVVIQWQPPTNYEYITKYNIVVEDEDGNVIVDEDLPSDSYTYTITGLRPGSSYNVVVRSYINDRSGMPVEEVVRTLPAKPAEVVSSNILSNQFEVSWTPAEGNVISYLVNVEPVGDSDAKALYFEVDRPSILVPDVEPETTYTVEVIAVGTDNFESNPTTITVTTGRETEERISIPEQVPEGTVALRPGQPEIVIRWEELPDQPVQSYLVLYRIQGTDQTSIITAPSGVDQTILSSLEPRENYEVWVRAVLETGENVPVRVLDRETVTHIPPENYTPLTEAPVVVPEDGQISIIWENLGPDINMYGVRYFKPNTDEEHQVVVPGTYSGTLLSGLTPGDEYIINVIGVNRGQPVVVENVNVGTTDNVPDENTASGTTPTGQITVQWVPELDEEDIERVIGFKIIFDRKCCLGEPEISWVPGNDSNSATIGMLEPDTEYVFRVEATTAEGENFPVPTINITNVPQFPETTSSPDLSPPDIVGVDGQGFTSTVYWLPADEGDVEITHYTVTYVPVDNEYVTTMKVLVSATETSHTMTGLAQDTLYRIEIQSTNLPLRLVSEANAITYLTPIEDEPVVEPLPPDSATSSRQEIPATTTTTPGISIRTRPSPRPDRTTTTGIPDRLRSTLRTTSRTTTTTTTQAPVIIFTTRRAEETTRRTPERPRTEATVETVRSTAEETTTTSTRTTPSRIFPTEEGQSTITSSPDGQMTLLWEPFFTEDENGNYYVILTTPDRPDEFREVTLPKDVDMVTLSSLEPDTPYNIHLEAVTDNDDVFLIPVTEGETELPRVLHPYKWLFRPTITSIEPYGEDSTIITWNNPRTQPRKVTHYVLNFNPKYPTDSNQNVKIEIPADKPRTSHVVTGLVPNEGYIVTLQVANAPTKTRSSTEHQDFVNGEMIVFDTTTRRPSRPTTTRASVSVGSTTTRPTTTPTVRTRPNTPERSTRRTTTAREPTPATTQPRRPDVVVPSLVPLTPGPLPAESTTRSTTTRRQEPGVTTSTSRVVVSSTTQVRPRTRPTPNVIVPSTRPTRGPEPVRTTPTEPSEGELIATTTQPTAVTSVTEVEEEEKAGVDALPTFDGNLIINWTPSETPVDRYILYYRPRDGSTPGRNVTIPGHISWASIPEPTSTPGYVITIYTVKNGESQPVYDIKLGKVSRTGGYRLTYGPSPDGDRKPTVTQTVTTQEVYIPGTRTEIKLPDAEYTLQPGGSDGTLTTTTDREYVRWLKPITTAERPAGGPSSVTLRWNPERTTTTTTRVNRYRVELVPVNDPTAETIIRYLPTNAPTNIRGLKPGVSYRLYAKYIQNDGEHRPGDIAADFVIPAFSRFGVPLSERRYGVNEVWMRELKSGELLLQWDAFPGATWYTIEYTDGPDGVTHRSEHGPDDRWIVLPRLAPGSTYILNIYATVSGTLTQIYTVTVRRKITAPSPPSKVQWYNMLGHSVDLTWIPPPSQITGYRITYKLGTADDAEQEFVVNLPANVTTYTLTGLKPGETYTVTIQAIRGDEISRPLTFTLTMLIPTVQRIYFQQTEPEKILIRWPLLPDYVTGYLVRVKQVSPPGADLVPETFLPPDQSEFTIKGIKPNVRYEFTIKTMVGDKLSDTVTLQLWTLRAESQLSQVKKTGTWTVTWSGDPYDVDYWRIEVKPYGSNTPVFVDDNINRFNTNYVLRDLTPDVEYVIYIYGIKNNITSTPIQIRIPVNHNRVIQRQQVTQRRQNIYASGPQLIRSFRIKRKPDQIELEMFSDGVIDSYVVKYKKSTSVVYVTRGVSIIRGDASDTAIIRNLEEGTAYNLSITAIRGDDRSEVNVDVGTPSRSVIRQPLLPLTGIERYPDPNPQGSGFFIRWAKPAVDITHYTVTYNYTQLDQPVTTTITERSIYVPNVDEGHSAIYVLSYTTVDGRESPKSIMTVSTAVSQPVPPENGDYYYYGETVGEQP